MATLPNMEKRLKIRRGESIEECGLDFYPIEMSHYELFVNCKDALLLRMSTLPVRYISKDYLSATFALTMDESKLPQSEQKGYFAKVLLLFFASLRIEANSETLNQSIFYREENGELVLDHLSVVQNEKQVEIKPFVFSTKIRPLLAELNGLQIPDESENADLHKSAEEKRELQSAGVQLKADLDDLIASVAYKCHVREKDVDTWTVREFESMRRAIDRDKRHTMYGQAELGGMVSFKNGNPFPSWCFDSLESELGTRALSELGQTLSGAKDKTT